MGDSNTKEYNLCFHSRIEGSLEISSFSRSGDYSLPCENLLQVIYNKSFAGFQFEANCAILIKQFLILFKMKKMSAHVKILRWRDLGL